MLEARFASLNPFMQHMFLKLHDIEDPEKKAFILETLCREFRYIAIEARKVLKRFNKLGQRWARVPSPQVGAGQGQATAPGGEAALWPPSVSSSVCWKLR
jgi:hypothetical protein